jgi:hypothetical protein
MILVTFVSRLHKDLVQLEDEVGDKIGVISLLQVQGVHLLKKAVVFGASNSRFRITCRPRPTPRCSNTILHIGGNIRRISLFLL